MSNPILILATLYGLFGCGWYACITLKSKPQIKPVIVCIGLISYAIIWPLFLITTLRTLTILKKTLKPFKTAHYVFFKEIKEKD